MQPRVALGTLIRGVFLNILRWIWKERDRPEKVLEVLILEQGYGSLQ